MFAMKMSAPAPCYGHLVGYCTKEGLDVPLFQRGNTSVGVPHYGHRSVTQYTDTR